MSRGRGIVVLSVALSAPVSGADAPPPADFKLVVTLYGARKPALARAEVVASGGVAYQFITDDAEEVTVIEPGSGRLQLLDLSRGTRTELDARRLDAGLGLIRQKRRAEIDRQSRSPGRADRVAASMSRDLIEPRFTEHYDPGAHRLRLTNPTVEVVADGVPEPDRARREWIAACLGSIAKLAAVREPEGTPPFPRLRALDDLAGKYALRPAEVNILYRTAGPPQRVRWTYEFVPELTGREREALARVKRLLPAARFQPFDVYEADAEKADPPAP